ncbi:MAG: hypothetical protein ACREIC_29305 [Limisphaerales bacterium]
MQRIIVIMLAVIATATVAMGDSLPGDRVIVPGVRIGAAELAPADQGALMRALGEPDRTDRNGDHDYYRYDAAQLTIDFDLVGDAPFEISTASPTYRTKEGMGVGSNAAEIRAHFGAPICEGGSETGDEIIAYDSIWFLLRRRTAVGIYIRAHINPGELHTGSIFCKQM